MQYLLLCPFLGLLETVYKVGLRVHEVGFKEYLLLCLVLGLLEKAVKRKAMLS